MIRTIAMRDTSQGGGSTITQQVAKNLFPRDTVRNRSKVTRTLKLVQSKFKEWITALKLEHNYTKEEIAAMYLNTVEYGSNAFGIKSAASTFFGKTPDELNIQEAAVLVGVVNAPTRYSPVRNPENALARRNLALPKYYRPPQGVYDENTLKKARELGYQTVFWSLAYADWDNDHQPDPDEAVEKLNRRIHDGAVVLLHATSKTNAEILKELLTGWMKMGYRFEPITELFR